MNNLSEKDLYAAILDNILFSINNSLKNNKKKLYKPNQFRNNMKLIPNYSYEFNDI